MQNSNNQIQREFKFNWGGPTGEPVSRGFGKPAPVVFFVKANEIRREHKISGPPFSPYDYASALGIVVEEVADMPIDGLLKRTESGRFLIQLRKDVSQCRKNFTLAHELAHTFFYNELMISSPKFRGSNKADPVEEALCNLGARELLMPRPIFKRDLDGYLQDGLITPQALVQLSRRYQVSLQALAIRVATIKKDFACAMWEKNGRAINMKWSVPKSVGRLLLCQTGKSSIELAMKGPPGCLIVANDSFYCTGRAGRRIIRSTLSEKSREGLIFSVMLPRGQCKTTFRGAEQPEVSEQWWRRWY